MDEDKCSRGLTISYRVVALVMISSYTVCVAVLVPDYHQALPFICITCFVAFCLCYYYAKRKFGGQISETFSKISTRMKWMKTRPFSMYVYLIIYSYLCFSTVWKCDWYLLFDKSSLKVLRLMNVSDNHDSLKIVCLAYETLTFLSVFLNIVWIKCILFHR